MKRGHIRALTTAAIALAAATSASTAQAFDPTVEAENFGKGNERSAIYNTPEYRQLLAEISAQNQQAALALQAADPERNFSGHLCASRSDGAAAERRGFVDRIIEFVVCDTANEADDAGVTPELTSHPQALWGMAWRARAGAWIVRHRRVLQNAIA